MTVSLVLKAGVNSRASRALPVSAAVGGDHPEGQRLLADGVLVDAGAVVADLDDDGAADAAGADGDTGLDGLAHGLAVRGRLAAVVDGVDGEVLQGVRDAVEHLLVELHVLA